MTIPAVQVLDSGCCKHFLGHDELRGKPAGTVRFTATEHAVRTLVWPRLRSWLPQYFDIKIEISSDNRFTDIVADRLDIGVRQGADVAEDMIAVRMALDMRTAVVCHPMAGCCRGSSRGATRASVRTSRGG